MLLGFVDKCWW